MNILRVLMHLHFHALSMIHCADAVDTESGFPRWQPNICWLTGYIKVFYGSDISTVLFLFYYISQFLTRNNTSSIRNEFIRNEANPRPIQGGHMTWTSQSGHSISMATVIGSWIGSQANEIPPPSFHWACWKTQSALIRFAKPEGRPGYWQSSCSVRENLPRSESIKQERGARRAGGKCVSKDASSVYGCSHHHLWCDVLFFCLTQILVAHTRIILIHLNFFRSP